MRSKILFSVSLFAILSVLFVAVFCLDVRPIPAPSAPAVSTVTRSATVTVHTSRLVNCEDHDVQPCWTLDGGAYVVVTSYAPYSGRTVKICPSKGASPLPCLARRTNAKVTGDPISRNYAWAGHL